MNTGLSTSAAGRPPILSIPSHTHSTSIGSDMQKNTTISTTQREICVISKLFRIHQPKK